MSTPPDPPREERSDGIPVGVEVQILATEHWGLLATRSMIWNEVFSRTGMFLTTLSAAAVALALVAQATDFGREFQLFAILVLPVVLLLGTGAFIRLTDSLEEEMWLVIGMNRLRRAYLDRAPDLEAHFVTSPYDDIPGLLQSFSGYGRPMHMRPTPGRVISSSVMIIGVLNCFLFGIVVALVVKLVGGGSAAYMLAGVLAAVGVAIVVMGILPFRKIAAAARYEPKFPRDPAPQPADGDGEPEG